MGRHVGACARLPHREEDSMSGMSSRNTSCTLCATPCVRLLYRPPEILAFVFVNLFSGVTFAAGVRNVGNRHLHKLTFKTFKFAEDILPWSRFFKDRFRSLTCTGYSGLTMYRTIMNIHSLSICIDRN